MIASFLVSNNYLIIKILFYMKEAECCKSCPCRYAHAFKIRINVSFVNTMSNILVNQ